jgi:hypothetical protein
MQAAIERQLIRKSRMLTSIVLAVCACVAANATAPRATAAPDHAFARVCAEQEVKAITALEDYAIAGDMPSDRLSAAGLMLLDARMTCYGDHVGEALTLYQRVIDLKGDVGTN